MKTSILKGALLSLSFAVASACTQSSAVVSFRPHPSDQQARAFLGRLVSLAEAKDFTALCSHGSLNCEQNLKDFDAQSTVPSTAPTVVGSRDVPDQDRSQGGRLLEVCGLDGSGQAYRSNVLFFGNVDNFTVIDALYWTPITFSEATLAPASSAAMTGPEWAGCPSGR